MLLELSGITKSVESGREKRIILKGINLEVKVGDSIAIKGRSGSGKTTLLNIIGALTFYDQGQIKYAGENIPLDTLKGQLSFRNRNIGYLTQQLNLLDDRSVFENISLPLKYNGFSKNEIKEKVEKVLSSLGMKEFIDMPIYNLSGGERQRIAIARAIVKEPSLLLADEPTGSLDEETEKEILKIFSYLKKNGITIIIVTHDDVVANYCDRKYELSNGKLNLIESL